MLTALAKLFKLLNSEAEPGPIAWAIGLAFLFALLPGFSLLKWCLLIIVCLFRINLSAFFLFSAAFSLLAYLLVSPMNQFGHWLLTMPSLRAFWSTIIELPVLNGLAINNTLALSAMLLGFVAFFPIYWLAKKGIVTYRSRVKALIEKWKVVKMLKSTRLFQVYQSLN